MQPSNLLKIESLDQDWRDKDTVMLHACFQLLKDCVEKEQLLTGHIDWTADARHRAAKAELQALYDWWLQRVDKENACDALDAVCYEEDTAMLLRLVQLRWALWT